MAYLACIVKSFRGAGFEDVITEAEVVAAGSVEGVMNGHHYNRSMRTHQGHQASVMHFLGCTNSLAVTPSAPCMYGIRKVKAVKTLLSNPEHCKTFQEMGTSFTVSITLQYLRQWRHFYMRTV